MSTKKYATYISSISLFCLKKEKDKTLVLLQKRQNTGFADGWWESGAAGHVDENENPFDAVVHEAWEELKIKIETKDLKFGGVCCKKNTNKQCTDKAFYIFYFFTNKWTKTPQVGESKKCSEIKWFDIKHLPKKIIPDRKLAIANYLKNTMYFNYNW